NLKLEHNLQQPIYPKLIDSLELLAESYSKSLSELHSFEHELEKIINSRIPEDIRKRLNDIISHCKNIRNDRILIEKFSNEIMNSKSYNKLKEIIKTKNFISRKQSLTIIIQIHKYFIK